MGVYLYTFTFNEMINISVILPSYKPGGYILDCLDSLMRQTMDASLFEVIIVLNGPKEPYWSMLSSYCSKYKNIKMYYEEIAGVSNARNTGLEVAKGEYIAFIDDDDIVSPSYLSSLLRSATKDTISISNVYSFVNSIDEKRDNFFVCSQLRNIEKKRDKERRKSFFYYRSFFAYPCGKLIHRDIICNHRFDTRFANGEDALFITSITDNLSKVTFSLDDAIYYVRERVGSASRKKISKSKILFDSYLLIKEYICIYLKHPFKYSFWLFASRIPGVLKGAYFLSKNI